MSGPESLPRDASEKLFEEAQSLMPGGVSSPVRSFASVGRHPFFVAGGSGANVYDVDGNAYLDFVQSWGALLFGHAHPEVVRGVSEAATRGTSFGTPSELEVELARLVSQMVPAAERVRFVSSGTEAAMTAIRLARGHTGRSKIVKFAGCYHGHSDALLADAGSGMATLGIPGTPGVTQSAVRDTVVVPYNDVEGLRAGIEPVAEDVAAVIVEPVAANMGLVTPVEGFLEGLREIADEVGAVLIFDEVITGFRLGPGGAQERFGVTADLVLLGKVLGGGLPVGAVAGRAEIMEKLAPVGPIYQAGTLSGNPVAMAAGIATLTMIRSDLSLYDRLQQIARSLARALVDAADVAARHPMTATAVGGLAGFFFSAEEVVDYQGARRTDGDVYASFFGGMLDRGIYLTPSRFEALFVTAAHDEEHVDRVAQAAREVLASI